MMVEARIRYSSPYCSRSPRRCGARRPRLPWAESVEGAVPGSGTFWTNWHGALCGYCPTCSVLRAQPRYDLAGGGLELSEVLGRELFGRERARDPKQIDDAVNLPNTEQRNGNCR